MLGIPFIQKFISKNGTQYVYDVNTQEIIRVKHEALYDLIDDADLSRKDEIKSKWGFKYGSSVIDDVYRELSKAQKDGFFLPPANLKMNRPACEECVNHLFEETSGKLILNITQDCNMRCRYCAFSGLYVYQRRHTKQAMPEDTAAKAIALFVGRGERHPELHISFYGGEPLLEFERIAGLVAYARSIGGDRKISFHIDTNGTLLDDSIIDYVIDNDIYLQISLDGPREIHDRYRVLKNGRGTFGTIMKNLNAVREKDDDYFHRRIGFSATLAPPYDLFTVNEFFAGPELPHLHVSVSFVDRYDTSFYDIYSTPEDTDEFTRQINVLKKDYISRRIKGVEPTLFQRDLIERPLVYIHTRERRPLDGLFPPNGICVPGIRRFYVETDGEFYPCERVGRAFRCGSVSEGISDDTAFRLTEDYISRSEERCSNCWAMRLCKLCFASTNLDGRFSIERKEENCALEKASIREHLSTYVTIMEKNGDAFEFVKDMVFD